MTQPHRTPTFGSLEVLLQGPPQQWLRVAIVSVGIVLALASIFTPVFWTVYISFALIGVWIAYPAVERRRRRPHPR